MTNNKLDAIKRLENKIAGLQATIDLINKLPDFPSGVYVWGTETAARICIPYNPRLLGEVRRRLGRDWSFKRSYFSPVEGWRLNTYQDRDGHELIISLEATEPGSTCRLSKVGERVVSVYDVVCN